MENLSDDLLVEILSRLPWRISLRCKSISKHFLALISSSNFIGRFIYHYHTLLHQMKEEDHENEWSLVPLSWHKLLLLPNLHRIAFDLSNPKTQLCLSFMGPEFDPKCEDVGEESGFFYPEIVGCSNGLLLCKKTVYCVCNPLTRDWVQLPPSIRGSDLVVEGFICEPHYHVQGDRRVTFTTPPHRFRVVLIPYFGGTKKSEFVAEVFSSETGRWNINRVSSPKAFAQFFLQRPVIAHGGRLYFMGNTSFLVYDPFNDDRQCHILDYPTDFVATDTSHVGVCCGNLRIADVSPTSNIVSVWELAENEDSGGGGWRLLQRSPLPPLEREDSVRPEYGAASSNTGRQVRVLAFHPYHGDVVFFQHFNRIFVGNLKTKKFQTATFRPQSMQTIPLDLPWWPTPVPSIN